MEIILLVSVMTGLKICPFVLTGHVVVRLFEIQYSRRIGGVYPFRFYAERFRRFQQGVKTHQLEFRLRRLLVRRGGEVRHYPFHPQILHAGDFFQRGFRLRVPYSEPPHAGIELDVNGDFFIRLARGAVYLARDFNGVDGGR